MVACTHKTFQGGHKQWSLDYEDEHKPCHAPLWIESQHYDKCRDVKRKKT